MLEEEIRKNIFNKLDSMEESLKYDIESLCEHLATIHELATLFHWINNNNFIEEEKKL